MKTECDRIKGISTSLRVFCRSDENNKTTFNLHDGIDSTLLILKHRLNAQKNRPAIEVVKDYGEFAVIKCFPGQINQAFMNILVNAINGFDEDRDSDFQLNPPKITIQTVWNRKINTIEIRIRDNGKVMPEGIKVQIFNDILTSQNLTKETGLGLAIAHQIVTEKHKGTLTVQSEVGRGTEFFLQLPIRA